MWDVAAIELLWMGEASFCRFPGLAEGAQEGLRPPGLGILGPLSHAEGAGLCLSAICLAQSTPAPAAPLHWPHPNHSRRSVLP